MTATVGERAYRVTHRTSYDYGEPVEIGHTVARLRPRTLAHQQVLHAAVDVEPEPTSVDEDLDGFGNQVTSIALERPHHQLVVTARSEVVVQPRPLPSTELWSAPWDTVVQATGEDVTADGLLARQCRLDSPLVVRHPDLADLAARAFTPGRPLGEAAAALTTRIFDDLDFVPGVTEVSTPVLEVLATRRGVCQDFAHLLAGALRSLGLGARYVSGYIETEPPPGQPRLVGADASHAWVGLYVPGAGWVDLDPTNGLVQPDRHVTVAWGRDYTDVVPVRGVLFGPPAAQVLSISVDVAALGTDAGAGTGTRTDVSPPAGS
ncbi:MAG TPA: transglutaminase family protein [Acidimicrobiales bacterium]|nr:transglutaminase family protein [Acidimicrobiales bacterium]